MVTGLQAGEKLSRITRQGAALADSSALRIHSWRSAANAALGAAVASVAGFLSASAFGATPEQAKAFAERASAYILEVGEEKAFAEFSRRDGKFVDGELYVFCYDRNGVNLAHGGNPAFVGQNLLHIKDIDGREPNNMIVTLGFRDGRGWVDFKWPNPVTKRIESKSAYVIRTHDEVCGVGYYKG